MLYKLTHIEQPYSGEFEEKIYNIESPWNSSDWSWIKFEEDDRTWCGEFRGKYRGAVFSRKLGIIVVLTSDYMYILDMESKELIEYERQPAYIQIIATPLDDILLSNGYDLEIFKGKELASIASIVLPVQVSCLEFMEFEGNLLKILCEEFYHWGHRLMILLDCDSLSVTVKEA